MKWKSSILACILHMQFPGAGKGSVSSGLTLLEALFVSEWQQRGAKDLVFLLKLVFPKSMGRGAAQAWVPPRCLLRNSQAGCWFGASCLKIQL